MAQIVNSLHSPSLDVTVLTDPVIIQAYKQHVADQMNAQSGGPTFSDLSERIADVIIETSAQGASLLEVHVIDPAWTLLISGFIQVDDEGLLWPPINVNFPKDSRQVWRLVQCRASSDLDQANLILTFEDQIASVLRDTDAKVGGVAQSNPGETLGGFINRLVDGAVRATGVHIQLVEMIAPTDPNYVPPVTPVASPRPDPNKAPTGPSPAQQDQIDSAAKRLGDLFSPKLKDLTIGAIDGQLFVNPQRPPDFQGIPRG